MSEEEIKDWLQGLVLCQKDYIATHAWVGTKTFEAIQGLLELYEKEKQKNIKLLEKLEMKKFLFVRKDYATKEILCEYYIKKDEIEKDYISKDKIREKIKELEKEKEDNKKLKEIICKVRNLSSGVVCYDNINDKRYLGPRKNFSRQQLYKQFLGIQDILKGNYIFKDNETVIQELLKEE